MTIIDDRPLSSMIIKIKTNSRFAAIAARFMKTRNIAIVFRNTIYLHNCSKEDFIKDTAWLRHEVAHVYQYKRYGFFLFIITYLAETIRKGYYHNMFEVEAREREKDENILEGVRIL